MSDYFNDEPELPLFAQKPQVVPVQLPTPFSGTQAENKKYILKTLQSGIRTCRDIDRLTSSRGQALIGELRKAGHKIETIFADGQSCYEYIGHNGERVRLPKSAQDAYYETSHWKSKSQERKKFDNFTCQQCYTSNSLEAHHWVYNLFAEQVETELITFCKTCHQFVHECIKGGACHFPRVADVSVAKQLGWNPSTKKWEEPSTTTYIKPT